LLKQLTSHFILHFISSNTSQRGFLKQKRKFLQRPYHLILAYDIFKNNFHIGQIYEYNFKDQVLMDQEDL